MERRYFSFFISETGSKIYEIFVQVSPGGGFGPVSDDGYGVSYMLPNDQRIFFHVSSKRSQPATDSSKFMAQLFQTLKEMRELFDEQSSTQA